MEGQREPPTPTMIYSKIYIYPIQFLTYPCVAEFDQLFWGDFSDILKIQSYTYIIPYSNFFSVQYEFMFNFVLLYVNSCTKWQVQPAL